MLWPKHGHDDGGHILLSIQVFRTAPVTWIIYAVFARAVMRSNLSKMRSCGKSVSAIIRRQYRWITSCAIYTRASASSGTHTHHVLHCQIRVLLFARWKPQSITLTNTCLIVRQMAASKCYIVKYVFCCSPDESLEVLHWQTRVLLFARWQPRSVTLPNACPVVRQMLASKCYIVTRRLLLFARWHPQSDAVQKRVLLFDR